MTNGNSSAATITALDTTLPLVVSSEKKEGFKFYDTRYELGLRTGVITKSVPLPVITDDDFVITGAETVITDIEKVIADIESVITADESQFITDETVITGAQTVITGVESVITQLKIVDESVFEYGDRLIKAMKQDFQRESDNLRTKNGVVETILGRIDNEVQPKFEKVIREVKITPKLRREIVNWLERDYMPYVNSFRRPKIQLEFSDWREGTKLKRA